MTNDFRFDDLDLREEPRTTARAEGTDYTGAQPKQGEPDAAYTAYHCTNICCV